MVIKKEELEKKYYSMSNEALAAEMDISVTYLLKLIDKAGIKKKGKGQHYDKKGIRVV